jgi:hypothetical protein
MPMSLSRKTQARTNTPKARTTLRPQEDQREELVPIGSLASGPRIWPFTSPQPDRTRPSDPVNIVFVGRHRDPRHIRDLLIGLDSDRPAVPRTAPFDARWTDAMGAVHAAYEDDFGWCGSVVQLELGSYDALRVHVRLFQLGEVTVGNAHVDVLVPGSVEHQVVAWDAALDVLRYDLQRSGALSRSPEDLGPLADSLVRTVSSEALDAVPVELRDWLGSSWPSPTPQQLPHGGRASVFELREPGKLRPGLWTHSTELPVNCTVRKPFCRDRDDDMVHLRGSVRLTQRTIQGSGRFDTSFAVQGVFQVTAVEDGRSTGLPYAARVSERYLGSIANGTHRSSVIREHMEFQAAGSRTRSATVRMSLGHGVPPSYSVMEAH